MKKWNDNHTGIGTFCWNVNTFPSLPVRAALIKATRPSEWEWRRYKWREQTTTRHTTNTK
jgi:hypothetical protein